MTDKNCRNCKNHQRIHDPIQGKDYHICWLPETIIPGQGQYVSPTECCSEWERWND